LAFYLRPLPEKISASIIRFHALAEVGGEIRFGVKKKDFLGLASLRMTRSEGTSHESFADGGAGCCGCLADRLVLVKEERTNRTRPKRLLGAAAFLASMAADPINFDPTPVAPHLVGDESRMTGEVGELPAALRLVKPSNLPGDASLSFSPSHLPLTSNVVNFNPPISQFLK
jgi:hypothetical protein